MILFDLDPNVVKPGWTPLLITIALAAVMFLLYLSMRRQFRKIDTNYPVAPSAGLDADSPVGATPAARTVDLARPADPAPDAPR